MKKLNSNIKGFSVLEVLVAIAISIVVSMVTIELTLSQFKALETARFRSEAANTATLARMVLQNEASCQFNLDAGNFATKAIPNPLRPDSKINITQIVYPTAGGAPPQVALKAIADKDADAATYIGSIYADNFRRIDSANNIFTANINILFKRTVSLIGGSQKLQSFPMEFQVDAAGNITSCSTAGKQNLGKKDLASICDFMGGTLSGDGKSCSTPNDGNNINNNKEPDDGYQQAATCTAQYAVGWVARFTVKATRTLRMGVSESPYIEITAVQDNGGGTTSSFSGKGELSASVNGGSCLGGGGGRPVMEPCKVTAMQDATGITGVCTGVWRNIPKVPSGAPTDGSRQPAQYQQTAK